MKKVLSLVLFAAAVTAFADEGAPKLLPGNIAPKITVGSWIKGEAPSKAGLHVVEFWATWCGPCKTSIPHLTELAHQYKGKVDFYGISVYERVPNIPEAVGDFVKAKGAEMDYNVAIDSTGKNMAKDWMEAAEQHGIPTAFIVDAEDKVLWIGHPMELDKPLASAVEGKLDWKPEREKLLKSTAAFKEANATRLAVGAAIKLYETGKPDEAEKEFDRIAANGEKDRQMIQSQRLRLYVSHKDVKREALVVKLINGNSGDQSLAAQAAFQQTGPKGDIAFARATAALLAVKATDTIALYYTALSLSKLDEHKRAVEVCDKAITALATDARLSRNSKFKESVDNLRTAELEKAKKVKG